MPNALADETSAYLRLHADEAIAWRPWAEAAFSAAAAEDKPLLVSIGYIACHWCHVMAREAYADPHVVELINRNFIAVKVDREERPDVDRLVLDALARLGARTGWPVTAVLTSAGTVYAGGSYYPAMPRHGLPSLAEMLARALDGYRAQRPGRAAEPDASTPGIVDRRERSAVADVQRYGIYLVERLHENLDPVYGGFGFAGPRFPHAAAHQLLWQRHMVAASPDLGDAVVASLTAICRSALVDHVGGGVHRYCVDDAWSEPHFEKMLYDNAQVLELLTWVWRVCRCPELKRCAEGIAAWSIAEMRVPGFGFAASLGADDPETGEEGAYYRWSEADVVAALGADAAILLDHYAVVPLPGGRGGVLLPREERRGAAADETRPGACVARLKAARDQRVRPLRDGKVLADWNGLMLVALVEAGSVFERRDWLAVAREVFDEIVARLGDGGSLRHSVTDGQRGAAALLDDYAMMSRAAIRLFEAFGKPRYLDHAKAWVATLDDAFWDGEHGGYCMSAAGTWSPHSRVRSITESAPPSGNALMIGVLARLHALTGEPSYAARADELVAAFHTAITRSGISAATAVANASTLSDFVSIKVSGDPRLDATRELMRIALECGLPDRLVLGPGAGDRRDALPMVQVCVGNRCMTPMTDVGQLRALLAPGGLAVAS